jgi:LssY C-terminus
MRIVVAPHPMSMRLTQISAAILMAAALGACTGSQQVPVSQLQYEERAVTHQRKGMSVTAAALSAAESHAVFGVPLAGIDVQPVWIEIDNQSERPRWFFPISVDPDYFPAGEVARRAAHLSSAKVGELYGKLSALKIKPFIGPGETASGFVYAHDDEGFKAFNVDLVGGTRPGAHALGDKTERFHFVVTVPGLKTDANDLFEGELDTVSSLDDDELHRWLSDLPCCTAAADGLPGDPVNIVLVGSLDTVRSALVSCHWDVTVQLTAGSTWRIAKAFVLGSPYRYAPMSGLYLFGRVQDLAFQKPRNVVNERNHMRIWLAPITHLGEPVWVGHVSRDIGVKLTGRVWPPVTHVIDGDVDDARSYLVEDLIYGRQVRRVGFAKGVGAASYEAPRSNAEGDPYFTDGLRTVVFLSNTLIPMSEIELLDWELPPAMKSYWQLPPVVKPDRRHGVVTPVAKSVND